MLRANHDDSGAKAYCVPSIAYPTRMTATSSRSTVPTIAYRDVERNPRAIPAQFPSAPCGRRLEPRPSLWYHGGILTIAHEEKLDLWTRTGPHPGTS